VNFNNNLPQKAQKVHKSREKKVFKLYIKLVNKETKVKFPFHKNFCVSFVPFVVFSFD